MGQEVVRAVCREPGMRIAGAVEQKTTEDSLSLPDGSGHVPFSSDLDHILASVSPDVMVDFSLASATRASIQVAAKRGVNVVIGTTGMTPGDLDEMARLAVKHHIGIVVASNFALGAVLMMHLAKIAARYFDYAEIIELHHHQKADFPSGTALTTARLMAQAKGSPFSLPASDSVGRGKEVEGITIHSVRLPGLLAHQEVILGIAGQTLTIRHDTISRECYMPGVLLAIREVIKRPGLTNGLDALLNLQEA